MIDLTRRLSPHFTLGELLRSEAAERVTVLREQQMSPPPEVVANLEHLATRTLEPARNALNLPLQVTSGYRCPFLISHQGNSLARPPRRFGSGHVKGKSAS